MDIEGLGARMHHEPVADRLLAHLRDRYGIAPVAATKLSVHKTYVFRIDRPPAHWQREASASPLAAHTYARRPDQPHAPLARLVSVSDHYRAPGWFTRNVFNQLVALLTRRGISVLGSRVLAVKGRTSGEWRTTPVNLLTHDGRRYLVAPRGETQWVRNLRAAGTGELRLGRRAESFRGRELSDDEKVPVLRAYLKRWKAEVGIFFEGTGPDSGNDQIRAIAPKHPAFEVLPVE